MALEHKTVIKLSRVWTVEGGQYGLTCNQTDYTTDGPELYCKSVTIPNCVDRTVYCSYPPGDAFI